MKYGNQNSQNISEIRKIVNYAPFMFPFLLNNWSVSELLVPEEANKNLESQSAVTLM